MSGVLERIRSKINRGIIAFVNMVSLSHRDWPYHDFYSDLLEDFYKSYQVGRSNMLGDGEQMKLFVSKSTLVMATDDALVVFNSANNVPITILANTWYTFQSNIYMVHYLLDGDEGEIYWYFEGVAPLEARRPE